MSNNKVLFECPTNKKHNVFILDTSTSEEMWSCVSCGAHPLVIMLGSGSMYTFQDQSWFTDENRVMHRGREVTYKIPIKVARADGSYYMDELELTVLQYP